MPKTVRLRTKRTAVPHYRGADLRLPPHAESPDPADLEAVREWVQAAPHPTAIDVFCGAGGLSLGLRDAGFTVLAGADHDARAVETHTANIGGLGYVGDLDDPSEFLDYLEAWGIHDVDLVAGGPPCQPFSRAGRSMLRNLVASGVRSEDDPRAGLWRGFVDVVRNLQPRAVLVENVPDLPAWNDGSVLIGFYESLGDLGYHVEARVLNAFEYGVPQHRARLILIGLRDGLEFEWPPPQADITTLYDAIGDLPPVPPAQRREQIPYFGAETRFQVRMRHDVPRDQQSLIFDHITRDIRPDDAEAFALLGEGDTYDDLPHSLRRYRSDIFTDKYKRLEWKALSRSITAHIAKDGYWYIHPEQHRTLSIREAARIQTFPDWFRFAGQATLRLKQIGNAVPPLLGEAVGRSLVKALSTPARASSGLSTRDFRARLLAWHGENRRPYPWRCGRSSPWHVLMGETCLTRTRPELVPFVFEKLKELTPHPEALVRRTSASEDLRALGLGARGELLLKIARVVVDKHHGVVPDSEMALRSLPGVGDYLAQAILCFGFGRRAVLLDTATARVAARHFGRDDKRRWQLRLDLYQLAGPPGPDAAFNAALLDLGAALCRAAGPLCSSCPVSADCIARSFINQCTKELAHAS